MTEMTITPNCLGLEIRMAGKLVALYRALEELDPAESPKPCFAPIYTPGGKLITQYRPKDHPWHTGLYYGWPHANECNLWGGPWYFPDKGKYEDYPGTHGSQRHESFDEINDRGQSVRMVETVTWRDAAGAS